MKNYYANMKLPEPVLPALQALELLKGQTALVTGAAPASAARSPSRWAGPAPT